MIPLFTVILIIVLQIQQNRAHTWEDALKLAKDNVLYVAAYEQLLSNPSMTLSASTKEMKDTMEHTRSLEDLRVLREVVNPIPPLKTKFNLMNISP